MGDLVRRLQEPGAVEGLRFLWLKEAIVGAFDPSKVMGLVVPNGEVRAISSVLTPAGPGLSACRLDVMVPTPEGWPGSEGGPALRALVLLFADGTIAGGTKFDPPIEPFVGPVRLIFTGLEGG